MSVTRAGLRAMEEMMEEMVVPVLLQHLTREEALELDRRIGLVKQGGGSGHVSAHLHDRQVVKFEHRDVGTLKAG